MSRGKIKPKRPKRSDGLTLMDCVREVMRASKCSEDEAKVRVQAWMESGKLPFHATLRRPGEPDKVGMFRVRDGKFVEEH